MGKAMAAMKAMRAMKKKAVSKIGKGSCLPWHQGEDLHWLDQERLGPEQAWQGRDQEAARRWQEELRQHQGLDRRRPEGQEGSRRQGLHGSEEGHSSLQRGQGALSVSIRKQTNASAQDVGMSTTFERHRLGCYLVLAPL